MTAQSIEVGRAVLACPTHDLELWLTTLITILPSQQAIDSQQLPPYALLRHLSSGKVWVGRGNGMRLEIELKIRGEQLPHQEREELVQSLISAPVWKQLNLDASLPSDTAFDGNVFAFNIGHGDLDISSEGRGRHRILYKVPSADVQPNSETARYHLQRVRFSLDILESKKRPPLKRSRTSPAERAYSQSQNDTDLDSDDGDGDLASMLHDLTATGPSDSFVAVGEVCSHTLPSGKRKRKLQRPEVNVRIDSLPPHPTDATISSLKSSVETLKPEFREQIPSPSSELEAVKQLIDGAMRLSISGGNNASTGLKVKANTFAVGLADVAPALWRPGYLTASSQRASLMPTISSSVCQLHQRRMMSNSLNEKLMTLTTASATTRSSHATNSDPTSTEHASIVSKHLWQRLQRSLLTRPCKPIQAFLAYHTEQPTQSDSDDILHENILHDSAVPVEFDKMPFSAATEAEPFLQPSGELSIAETGHLVDGPAAVLTGSVHYGFDEIPIDQQSQDRAGGDGGTMLTRCLMTVPAIEGHFTLINGTEVVEVSNRWQRLRNEDSTGFISREDTSNEMVAEAVFDL